MRRFTSRRLVFVLCLSVTAFGCGQKAPPPSPSENAGANTSSPAIPANPGATAPFLASAKPDLSVYLPAEPSKEDKYNAALHDAIARLTEQKHADALASLEVARSFNDTEQVRQEIARVKLLIEQQTAAERTADDIQAILRDGKAEEASRLATAALQQYGGTDAADRLTKLKRQADALVVAQIEDQAAKRARFRAEAEAALREKNLRAAAIAFEQALQFGDDPALRQQHGEIRKSLTKYDDSRARAAELRRDPYQLEDAIALYQDAAKAWDTLQVRQEIDECQLALSKRRDRISVADFEIRGDVGIPALGRTIAEELLPAFKSRFDIVERAQLGKVLAELKLEASELAENDSQRRQVGELAKVRYLVLGSVTRVSGALVSARVVDVRTGLVVQTAKLTVASPDELLGRLPQLAQMLMMSDEQRLAYEYQVAQQPGPGAPIGEGAPLIAHSTRPPDLGVIQLEAFERIPTTPPASGLSVDLALPMKNKFLGLSLELGDDLFRRGRFTEAIKHFEFAYALHPEREDLRVRIDRCRPHLPPAPPVVVTPPVVRPRLAIINFVSTGDPHVVPPGLGAWTAEQIGSYFCPPYDVIDRGEVFWWMGRLGMTVRDLMEDPAARRYLGRALNVRFFLLGTIRQTASFDATTHLIDAERGVLTGSARVHVRNQYELKLRLGELARLTLLDPRERQRFEQDRDYERVVLEGRQRFERGEFSIALELFGRAKAHRPFSIEIQVLVDQCEVRSRQAALEEARRREFERARALAAEFQRRQAELARQAEAARIRAEQEAAALAEAARRAQEEQRLRAQQALVGQARIALQAKNFNLSIQLFESATAMRPSDELYREFALARARAEEETRAAAAREQARREQDLREQREKQVILARAQIEEARRRREAEERVQREAQAVRDQAEYTKLLDAAQRLQAEQKYDQAAEALQRARRLKKTDEVERLLQAALTEQARAIAQKKDAAARAELEKQLAAEKARREAAEAEAKKNHDLYLAALTAAQKALNDKNFDLAAAKYNEAGKLYKTDVVLTGLKQVDEARKKETAVRDEVLKRQAEAAKKEAEFKRLMSEGQAALAARQYVKAIALFKQATELKPGDVDAIASLSKAEQGREEQRVVANRKREEGKAKQDAAAAALAEETKKREEAARKLGELRTAITQARAAVARKDFDAADKAHRQAVQLDPSSVEVEQLRKEIEAARYQAKLAAVEAQKKAEREKQLAADEAKKREHAAKKPVPPAKSEPPKLPAGKPAGDMKAGGEKKPSPTLPKDFAGLMQAGAAFEKQKQWAEAVQAYREAARLNPNDAKAAAALINARFEKQMAEGRENLKAGKFKGAVADFEIAVRLKPKDAEATRLLEQAKRGM